ncbi:MAG: hypothetical protein WKF86_05480 [Acidimicrobiales bacterium]
MTLSKSKVVSDATTTIDDPPARKAGAREVAPGFIPEEVRRSWFALAADLERRQADLSHLVTEIRRAIATSDKVTSEWCGLSDEMVDATRAAFGIDRLSDAVDAASLARSSTG